MSILESVLAPEFVRSKISAASRKRVLQVIATALATEDATEDTLFDGLMARERLGSTGIGDGVAVPHCRAHTDRIRACLVTTEEPLDYEASDGQRVDLFFALVVPEDEHQLHLTALKEISQILADEPNRLDLRACRSNEDLHVCVKRALNRLDEASL